MATQFIASLACPIHLYFRAACLFGPEFPLCHDLEINDPALKQCLFAVGRIKQYNRPFGGFLPIVFGRFLSVCRGLNSYAHRLAASHSHLTYCQLCHLHFRIGRSKWRPSPLADGIDSQLSQPAQRDVSRSPLVYILLY